MPCFNYEADLLVCDFVYIYVMTWFYSISSVGVDLMSSLASNIVMSVVALHHLCCVDGLSHILLFNWHDGIPTTGAHGLFAYLLLVIPL